MLNLLTFLRFRPKNSNLVGKIHSYANIALKLRIFADGILSNLYANLTRINELLPPTAKAKKLNALNGGSTLQYANFCR